MLSNFPPANNDKGPATQGLLGETAVTSGGDSVPDKNRIADSSADVRQVANGAREVSTQPISGDGCDITEPPAGVEPATMSLQDMWTHPNASSDQTVQPPAPPELDTSNNHYEYGLPNPWPEINARQLAHVMAKDTFVDDPEYLEFRNRNGPDKEFEEARAQSLLSGFEQPWRHRQFALVKELADVDLLASDPKWIIAFVRRVLGDLEDVAGVTEEFTFDRSVMRADEFLGRDYKVQYLIDDVLPAGQICIAGGPEKGQKSNLLIDAAISLAAGKPWLGHFAVSHACKVLYLTGETQGANLQNIMLRVMSARGVTVADLGGRLLLKEALPRFDDEKQLAVLRDIISQEKVEVVMVDPLYFALGQVDSHLLTQVGPTVAKVGKLCINAGATPIFLHHMSKTAQMRRGEEREPMQLADLNGAGFGPVAGSWILINYLAPYDPETGACLLWLSVGGRAGHGGLYALGIEEGPFIKSQLLNGRFWRTDVQRGQAARDAASQVRGAERQAKKAEEAKTRAAEDEKRMVEILDLLRSREPVGAIQTEIASKLELQEKVCKRLLVTMSERLWITRAPKQPGDNPNSHRWRPVGTVP